MKAMRSIQYTLNIIKYAPALSEIPLSEDKTLTSEERSTKKRKGLLFIPRERERERERDTAEARGKPRVPVEYKDTQSSRKKGGGMRS